MPPVKPIKHNYSSNFYYTPQDVLIDMYEKGQIDSFIATQKLKETDVMAERERLQKEIESKYVDLQVIRGNIRRARQVKESNNRDQRMENLFSEYPDVPRDKLEKVWEKAYEMGHSSGFNEVRNYFYDLIDLVQ